MYQRDLRTKPRTQVYFSRGTSSLGAVIEIQLVAPDTYIFIEGYVGFYNLEREGRGKFFPFFVATSEFRYRKGKNYLIHFL